MCLQIDPCRIFEVSRAEGIACARWLHLVAIDVLRVAWNAKKQSIDFLQNSAVVVTGGRDGRKASQELDSPLEQPVKAVCRYEAVQILVMESRREHQHVAKLPI